MISSTLSRNHCQALATRRWSWQRSKQKILIGSRRGCESKGTTQSSPETPPALRDRIPLTSLPAGKGVVSAKVTLHEYGGSATKGVHTPSLIQVASVNQGWNPATLSWNNAPLIKENISRTVVNSVSNPTSFGQPYSWDVSKALADAYAAGQPLRLVFYSSDSPYNTGKYFFSSTLGSWGAVSRPTLQATLGNVAASSAASVQSSASRAMLAPAARGQQIALGGLALDTQQTLPPAKVDEHLLYFAPLLILPAPLFFLLWTLRRRRLLRHR